MQNYGNATPSYDGNAYPIPSSHHPGTGKLQMYATHPSQPLSRQGNPQYYTTQVNTYATTGNSDGFRSGAAAYRNARDWTQQQRNSLIAGANIIAERRSAETRSFSRASNSTNTRLMTRKGLPAWKRLLMSSPLIVRAPSNGGEDHRCHVR